MLQAVAGIGQAKLMSLPDVTALEESASAEPKTLDLAFGE
jgi:hypothetical protein